MKLIGSEFTLGKKDYMGNVYLTADSIYFITDGKLRVSNSTAATFPLPAMMIQDKRLDQWKAATLDKTPSDLLTVFPKSRKIEIALIDTMKYYPFKISLILKNKETLSWRADEADWSRVHEFAKTNWSTLNIESPTAEELEKRGLKIAILFALFIMFGPLAYFCLRYWLSNLIN